MSVISNAMKTLILIIALMFLLTINNYGQQNINMLNAEIMLPSDSITKADLLDTISIRLNVHFSYNPDLLGAHNKVKLQGEKMTLLNILSAISDPNILDFHVLNDQIIFYPAQKEIEKKAAPKEQFLVLKGSITDRKEKEAIPFCNVALIGTGLGSVSNDDGIFQIKIPSSHLNDTLRFSCMGYLSYELPIASVKDSFLSIALEKTIFRLKTVEIVHYQPAVLLQKFFENQDQNYENNYTLLTTFYREIIRENKNYTDISEAVLDVLKAPYSYGIRDDLVKFIKGRKSSDVQPFDEIKFRLKGGPYYITKLDVVKNCETFINPEFINLFNYEFENKTLIAGRETAVISFSPVSNLRDLLYEGLLYFDIETGALARVEFNYTKQGLKEARSLMIEKEPREYKAIPTDLSYVVEYSYIDGKWQLLSAHSSIQIKMIDKGKNQKTIFHSISEILVTNIEKGDLQHFSRKDIFRPNEFFTEKITSYDKEFWENYNVIEPEEALEDAVKNFNDRNLIITNK
jgi:hypothetical protein